jgi:ferredoxin
MALKTPDKFIPNPEQMALRPPIKGNAINGLGEAVFRKPSKVYWSDDTDNHPFGKMQQWFYAFNNSPELMAARAERAKYDGLVVTDKAPKETEKTTDEWVSLICQYAMDSGASLVGITKMNTDWMYEGKSTDLPWVIVCGLAQGYDEMATAPEPPASAEVIRLYGEGHRISKEIASFIQENGFNADPRYGPMAGDLTMVPAALAAGLGELGKHGSIINRKYGSNFRLVCIMTDLPLKADMADDFGADGFCTNCQICVTECPPGAIIKEKQLVRGKEKWYVDFDKCLPYFNENAGCGICMVVCPWSRPGVAENLADRLIKKRKREQQQPS